MLLTNLKEHWVKRLDTLKGWECCGLFIEGLFSRRLVEVTFIVGSIDDSGSFGIIKWVDDVNWLLLKVYFPLIRSKTTQLSFKTAAALGHWIFM